MRFIPTWVLVRVLAFMLWGSKKLHALESAMQTFVDKYGRNNEEEQWKSQSHQN